MFCFPHRSLPPLASEPLLAARVMHALRCNTFRKAPENSALTLTPVPQRSLPPPQEFPAKMHASDCLNTVFSTGLSLKSQPSIQHSLAMTSPCVTCAPLITPCVSHCSIVAPAVSCTSASAPSHTCGATIAPSRACAKPTLLNLTRTPLAPP